MLATQAATERVKFSLPTTNAEQTLDKKRAAVVRDFVEDLFIHLEEPASLGRYMAYECKPDCSACFCKRVAFVREDTSTFLRAYHTGRVTVLPYASIRSLRDCASFPMPALGEIYGIVSGSQVMMYFLFAPQSDKLVSFCTDQQEKYFFAF